MKALWRNVTQSLGARIQLGVKKPLHNEVKETLMPEKFDNSRTPFSHFDLTTVLAFANEVKFKKYWTILKALLN